MAKLLAAFPIELLFNVLVTRQSLPSITTAACAKPRLCGGYGLPSTTNPGASKSYPAELGP